MAMSSPAPAGTVFSPVIVIDPSQSVTTTQATVRGPALIGPVLASIDSVDGGRGYAFINHGTISAVPTDLDISSLTLAIQGSSATNYTCLSGSSTACTGVPATPGTLATTGGLLNTGTIRSQAITKEDTTSNLSATTVSIGAFATVPRFDVAGEFVSGNSFTPGAITAAVQGPGGGIATALQISNQAVVPQIDVLQHGTIIANISTSTISPDAINATAASPFTQSATAIRIRRAASSSSTMPASILATTTLQTPGANASVVNSAQAINLLAGTTGGTRHQQ